MVFIPEINKFISLGNLVMMSVLIYANAGSGSELLRGKWCGKNSSWISL